MGDPDRDHRQGGGDFFENIRGEEIRGTGFSEEKKGAKSFSGKNKEAKTFFEK